MSHLTSILWLAFWPVLIFIIYKIALWAIRKKGYLYDEREDQS
jgi:hypothetical protein